MIAICGVKLCFHWQWKQLFRLEKHQIAVIMNFQNGCHVQKFWLLPLLLCYLYCNVSVYTYIFTVMEWIHYLEKYNVNMKICNWLNNPKKYTNIGNIIVLMKLCSYTNIGNIIVLMKLFLYTNIVNIIVLLKLCSYTNIGNILALMKLCLYTNIGNIIVLMKLCLYTNIGNIIVLMKLCL